MNSIRNYGFNPGHMPIVMATSAGHARVIDGMHRVTACQRLLSSDWPGKHTIAKIPCIVLDKEKVDAVTEKLIAQSMCHYVCARENWCLLIQSLRYSL